MIVRFFHKFFAHTFLTTVLSIISSSSIVNIHPDLTSTAVRKFFPYGCPACPAGQLAQRHQALVEIIPYTLPGQASAIDFKGPWTASDGTPTRSLSGNLYTFTDLDLVADYAFVAYGPNRCGILKNIQKLKSFLFAIMAIVSEFFTDSI